MGKFAKLIEGYYFQIALTIFFITLALFVPFLYFPLQGEVYPGLSLRCFFLDLGSCLVFFLLSGGRFKSLLLFSLSGLLSSLLYLKFHLYLLIPLCLAFTITSVIMVSFLAYLKLSSVE